jgi:hypothetical protein
MAAPAAAADGQPALTFEAAFQTSGEPPALYYRAAFQGRDGPHALQVWRDGQTRLRRKTDEAVDTYITRDPSDPLPYQMTVVDYRKRITTRIDRDNLIRLGHFSDWFDLAHGLRHPAGAYRLTPAAAPANAPAPMAACRWYALTQGGDTHRICWSERESLPLVIWSDRAATALWQVTAIERQPIAEATFTPRDAGFVRNDANDDMDKD